MYFWADSNKTVELTRDVTEEKLQMNRTAIAQTKMVVLQ